MEKLLYTLAGNSLTSGLLILVVICFRFTTEKNKMPKWIRLLLWGIVALRLVLPFSLKNSFGILPDPDSIINRSIDKIAYGNENFMAKSQTETVTDSSMEKAEDEFYADPELNTETEQNAGFEPKAEERNSADYGSEIEAEHYMKFDSEPKTEPNNTLKMGIFLTAIWVCGIILMLLYAFLSRQKIRFLVEEAVVSEGNQYLCDRIDSPFILGIINPRIYLPSDIDSAQMKFVLAHENAHIKRGDHLWKPLGFMILCLYWFHPLVWVSYLLFCRDIELACDEKVVKNMDLEQRKAYSLTLLNLSLPQKTVLACPLAFGEVGVKERIKSVLKYRKATRRALIAAAVFCGAACILFFTCRPQKTILYFDIMQDLDARMLVLSETEICPNGEKLLIRAGKGVEEGQVALFDAQTGELIAEPVYFERILPTELEVEKGKWYLVGISVSLSMESEGEREVSVEIENVRIRTGKKHSETELVYRYEPEKMPDKDNVLEQGMETDTKQPEAAEKIEKHMAMIRTRLSVFGGDSPDLDENEVTYPALQADSLYQFLAELPYEEGSFDNLPEITVFFDDGIIALIDLNGQNEEGGTVELKGLDQCVRLSGEQAWTLEKMLTPAQTDEIGYYFESGKTQGGMKHLTDLPQGEITWLEVTKEGVNEILFRQNLDVITLSETANLLKTAIDKEVKAEADNPDIVITQGWTRIFESDEYQKVLNLGTMAAKPLYWILYTSGESGFYEYLAAAALEEISGYDFRKSDEDSNLRTWSNAEEFLDQFTEKIIDEGEENRNSSDQTTGLRIIGEYSLQSENSSNSYWIDDENVLWGMGWNQCGQLSLGNCDYEWHEGPVKIAENVIHVDCSETGFVVFLTKDHELYGLGAAGGGALMGYSSITINMLQNPEKYTVTKPRLLMKEVILACCGRDDVVCIAEDMSVWTWGTCYWTGSGIMAARTIPEKILENAVYITGGMFSHAALTQSGELYTWGYNYAGSCGVEDEILIANPVKAAENVRMVWTSTGKGLQFGNTIICKNDGSYYACGPGLGEEKILPVYFEALNYKIVCTEKFLPIPDLSYFTEDRILCDSTYAGKYQVRVTQTGIAELKIRPMVYGNAENDSSGIIWAPARRIESGNVEVIWKEQDSEAGTAGQNMAQIRAEVSVVIDGKVFLNEVLRFTND